MKELRTGENLVRVMEREGVSIRALARETGLSLNTIRHLRRPGCWGNLETWGRIANALGIELSELLRSDE